MSHLTVRHAYRRLADRLNRFPQGAPPSQLLFEILAMLFSEREAELVAQVPIKPFSADKAAAIWKLPLAEAQRVLDALCSRAILLDLEQRGRTWYVLPPPMAGFFEFSLMRIRGDIDQKRLAELFYLYLNVEEEFIRALFAGGETQQGRVYVQEAALTGEQELHVLDYERASEVIRSASAIGVGLCYCRHKMAHLDRACDAPLDICLTFNTAAASLIRAGAARAVDAVEGIDLLQQAQERSLVQFGENVRQGVSFLCNCCGCCCEAMIAARKFGHLNPVHTTRYLAAVSRERCTGCGRCLRACPVEALGLVGANDPWQPQRRTLRVDAHHCLGCGVCLRHCPAGALTLEERGERVLTPLNSTHRAVVMAIERGKLQHLIFDNRALWSHRAMAALLGVILRLPPVQRTLASRQLKSRYLERLVARVEGED